MKMRSVISAVVTVALVLSLISIGVVCPQAETAGVVRKDYPHGAVLDIPMSLGINGLKGITGVYVYGLMDPSGNMKYYNASKQSTTTKPTQAAESWFNQPSNIADMVDDELTQTYHFDGSAGKDTKVQIPVPTGIPVSGADTVCRNKQYDTYYLVFPLKSTFTFNTILAGRAEDAFFNVAWFGEVYASQSFADIFDQSSRVADWNTGRDYDEDMGRAITFTLPKSVTANYIGLVLPAQQYSQLRIGEFGVFNVINRKGNVLPMLKGSDYGLACYQDLINSGDNLLDGVAPRNYAAGSVGGEVGMQFGYGMADEKILHYNYETDNEYHWIDNKTGYSGNTSFTGFTDPGQYTKLVIGAGGTTEAKIVFPLKGRTAINRVVWGMGQDSSTASAPNLFYKTWYVKVYLSNDAATLYDDASLVGEYSYVDENGNVSGDGTITDIGLIFTMDKEIEAKYVGFAVPVNQGGIIRFSEVGAYGVTSALDRPVVELNSFLDRPLLEGNNLVNASNIYTYKKGTIKPVTWKGDSISKLTDGLIRGINHTSVGGATLYAANAYESYIDAEASEAVTTKFVIDLGSRTTVRRMVVGFAGEPNVQLKTWKGDVYAGDDLASLFSGDTVAQWDYSVDDALPRAIDAKGIAFNFTSELRARYVGLEVPVNMALYTHDNEVRFQELAIFGTSGPYLNKTQVLVRGTDLQDTASLRFVSTVPCKGLAADGDGHPDYTNATVLVEGTEHPMTGMGLLVSRRLTVREADADPDTAMTLDNLGGLGLNVPAKRMYDLAGEDASFGVTVQEVPAEHYGDVLLVRPYVTYTDDGKTCVQYGAVEQRTLYEAWREAAEQESEIECRMKADYLPASTTGGYFAQNSRVVFLGDSITYAGSFIQEIFSYYASQHTADRVKMYMAGIQGGTAAGGLAYLEDDTMAYSPDYVSVMFGMNDIGREGYSTGYANASAATRALIDTYADNMEELVTRLQEKGIKVIICTPTIYDDTCTNASAAALKGCGEALRICGEKAAALAKKTGCLLVDFNTVMTEANAFVQQTNSGYSIINNSDRVHPGLMGHDLMARLWLNAVGEKVPVPTNAQLLQRLQSYGSNYAQSDFADMGLSSATARFKSAVSNAIDGVNKNKVRTYWEGEFFCVGPEYYADSTLEERIAMAASHSSYSDWRSDRQQNFASRARSLGANMKQVLENTEKVYTK